MQRRIRDDAARERESLKESYDAQLRGQQSLTETERERAARAESLLESERAERRQLTTSMTARQNGRAPSGNRTAKKTGQRRTTAAAAATGTD